MAVRNQHWSNLNEARAYPLDDSATLVDDLGTLVPAHILSDLKLMVPESAGKYLYLGALSVTPRIVTFLVMATDDLDVAGQVVLSINQTLPIDRNQQYELTASIDHAGGWVSFGGGILEATGYRGRFTSPRQSFLAPHAATWFRMPPIPSAAKLNNPGLTGLVALIGGNDIEIVSECREVLAHPVPSFDPQYCGSDELGTAVRNVIVFRLVSTETGSAATAPTAAANNVFDLYKGTCGNRPESGNCGTPEPIEFLGPVAPDCCGNITLTLKGCADVSRVLTEVTIDDQGDPVFSDDAYGVVLYCGLGLSDACVTKDRLPTAEGRLPNEYDDLCESVSFVSVSDVPVIVYEDSFSFDNASALAANDPSLPYTDTFGAVSSDYVASSGEFKYYGADASNPILLQARSTALRNVITFEPTPPVTNVFYKTVSSRVTLVTAPGGLHNAAVLANYRATGSGSFRYHVAEIDWDGHYRGFKLFRIAKFSGTSWVNLFAIAVPELQLEHTYDIELDVFPHPADADMAFLVARLRGVTNPAVSVDIGPLAVSNFGPADGLFGMGTNRALTKFLSFSVENASPP